MKTYKGDIKKLEFHQIFVFGSNTEGRHGKGAALKAKLNFGAIQFRARGLQGQSYAIVTKDLKKEEHPSRTPEQIKDEIRDLYRFAVENPMLEFFVAYKDNGEENLNAYTAQDMANFFDSFLIPVNIVFEESFNNLIMASHLKNKI